MPSASARSSAAAPLQPGMCCAARRCLRIMSPLVKRHAIEEDVMRNLYTNEKLFEDLFGFRREFNEMFNRILTGKPWGLELPEFKKTFNITPAVEAYVDKEAKKYVCRVTLPGVEPKDLQIHAQANLLTI